MSASLDILREQGPMSLRDLARVTALEMGWTLLYDDVHNVMCRHEQRGEATCEPGSKDYRDAIWSATASAPERSA